MNHEQGLWRSAHFAVAHSQLFEFADRRDNEQPSMTPYKAASFPQTALRKARPMTARFAMGVRRPAVWALRAGLLLPHAPSPLQFQSVPLRSDLQPWCGPGNS